MSLSIGTARTQYDISHLALKLKCQAEAKLSTKILDLLDTIVYNWI
ncbi:MAG: hypothetical protein PHW31_02235 [Candidatus Pacebacteria bacterium]|nr:hypothetical protein [Candidatus Paceibacterota bacterium]